MTRLTPEQRKAHNANYYDKNKETQIARNKRQRALLRNRVLFVKMQSECKLCGEKHPAALQFHHRDPKDKILEVSIAVNRGWALDKLNAEIAKCDIICANCHLKLHWDERDGNYTYDAPLTQQVE